MIEEENEEVMEILAEIGVSEAAVELALMEAGLEAEMMTLAHEVEDYWRDQVPDLSRGSAPTETEGAPVFGRRPPKRDGPVLDNEGDYRDSIRIDIDPGRGLIPDIEVGTDLMPLALLLEYGSIHNPEYGYLARTIEHFSGESEYR